MNETKFKGIEKQFSMLFSSSLGANVDPLNKGSFSVNLYNGISVPDEAKSAQIGLYSANIWNSSPNVVTGENDKMHFIYLGSPFDITIPQGLYSVEDLQNQIQTQILLEAVPIPDDIVQLLPNEATQQIIIQYNYTDSQVDFTQPNTVRDLLGFNSRLSPAAPTTAVGQLDQADLIAAFNQYNSFLILANDLVLDGLPVNSTAVGVLAQIPLSSPPNSLINHIPPQIQYIQADHLIGHNIFDMTFRLTNENAEPVFVVENWTFGIIVKYTY